MFYFKIISHKTFVMKLFNFVFLEMKDSNVYKKQKLHMRIVISIVRHLYDFTSSRVVMKNDAGQC